MEITQLSESESIYRKISYSNSYIFVVSKTCLKHGRFTHFDTAKIKSRSDQDVVTNL